MGWYRVILDEARALTCAVPARLATTDALELAENIRNRSTKISRSCAQLDSLFRWTLTGTPVTNSLADRTRSAAATSCPRHKLIRLPSSLPLAPIPAGQAGGLHSTRARSPLAC